MDPLQNRPVACAGVFFALGTAAAYVLQIQAWFIAVAVAVVAIVLFLTHRRFALITCIGALAFALAVFLMLGKIAHQDEAKAQMGTLRGTVCAAPIEYEFSTLLLLNDCTLDNTPLEGRVKLYVQGKTLSRYQDQVRAAFALLAPPQGKHNPGAADPILSSRLVDARYISSVPVVEIVTQGKGVLRTIYDMRDAMRMAIDKLFEPQVAGVVKGMLLGDTSQMDEQWLSDFRLTGIAHVLAVSGMNVAIVLSLVLFICKKCNLKRVVMPLVAVVLFVYCAMAGFSSSMLRASFMCVILLLGKRLGENGDILSALGFAAVVLLIINPFQLFAVGFLMSFGAVIGIVAYTPRLLRLGKCEKLAENKAFTTVWSVACVSLGAQLGVLPVQLYVFGTLPVLSVFANILIAPFIGVVTIGGLFAAVFGAVALPLGVVFAFAISLCVNIMGVISSAFAKIPFSTVTVGVPGIELFALLLLLAALCRWCSKRARLICTLCALVCVLSLMPGAAPRYDQSLEIVFLDVGQGDAIYIRQGNAHILLDGGNSNGYIESGERVILPFLRYKGVTKLDAVIVSHPDADHCGGLIDVCASLNVGRIIHGPQKDADEQLASLREVAAGRAIPLEFALAGRVIPLGQARLRVLSPVDASSRGNDASLVLLLEYGSLRILFTGDASAQVENSLALSKLDVLKVAHHGGKESTSAEFLSKVRPKYAVISVGNNSYGLPSQAVLDNLNNAGVTILRTDVNGAITFVFDQGKEEVRVMKKADWVYFQAKQ